MSLAFRLPLPTDSWARLLLAPAVVFIATAVDRNYQTDFWHHLARGRAVAEQGRLVNEDLFTYTVSGHPFQDNNWLTQLFYYWLYRQGGLDLVQVVNSLAVAVTLGVLVWQCRRASGSAALAAGLGVFAFVGLWQVLIIRPQTFSLLLFVVLYAILEGAERRRRLLFVPPLVLALWANLHGGFPVGLLLVGCFTAAAFWDGCRRRGPGVFQDSYVRALGLCLAGCVLATFVNPYGPLVYQYVRTTSATASGRGIDEWLPPNLGLLIGKVWVASVLGLLFLFAFARRRPTTRELCLVACFLPLACSSVRMVAWWLLVSVPVMASLAAGLLPRRAGPAAAETPTPGAAFFCGTLVLAGVLSLPALEPLNPLLRAVRDTRRTEDDLEEIATQLSADGAGHRVFCRFEWGEYLSWSAGPRCTVFMDGRIEIYPDKVWADYSHVTRARADWQQVLDGYGVDCLLLDTTFHYDLLPQVEKSAAWRHVGRVGNAVLFRRQAEEQGPKTTTGPER